MIFSQLILTFVKSNRIFLFIVLFVIFAACSGGRWNFARTYYPGSGEKAYYKQAITPPFLNVNKTPEDFENETISWFGIVKKVETSDDGHYILTLSHHTHQPRHLCETESNESCRVTVNAKSAGDFSILLTIKPEDIAPGTERLQKQSLLHIYGQVRCRKSEGKTVCDRDDSGNLFLNGLFYRYWPKRYYVTTLASSTMVR
jgi:hypothetical protein